MRSNDDPATSGNDGVLLDHCQITYTSGLETCLFFHNLQDGDYEVIIYAWMPGRPDVMSRTSCDEAYVFTHFVVGGAWPGAHQPGVTYSRQICRAGPPNPGLLRTHSGIVPGANPADGAAFNGVQIRQLPARRPGDLNCDGQVNGEDIPGFLKAIQSAEAYYAEHPTCRVDNADVNSDFASDAADVAGFVNLLLTS